MRKYKPYTGRTRLTTTERIGVAAVLIVGAVIGTMQACKEADTPAAISPATAATVAVETWRPYGGYTAAQPEQAPTEAQTGLTAADTKARLDRYEADVLKRAAELKAEEFEPEIESGEPLELIAQFEPPMAEYTEREIATVTSMTGERSYTEEEAIMLCKTVYGEAGFCAPDEQRLVVWCVLQRVDDTGDFARYSTIKSNLLLPLAFVGYMSNNPVLPEIYDLVIEELEKWVAGEKPPTHPIWCESPAYFYFDGGFRGEDGSLHNKFRENFGR